MLTLHELEPRFTSLGRQCCSIEQGEIEAASEVKFKEEKENKRE
jgi:hypothetical protein